MIFQPIRQIIRIQSIPENAISIVTDSIVVTSTNTNSTITAGLISIQHIIRNDWIHNQRSRAGQWNSITTIGSHIIILDIVLMISLSTLRIADTINVIGITVLPYIVHYNSIVPD